MMVGRAYKPYIACEVVKPSIPPQETACLVNVVQGSNKVNAVYMAGQDPAPKRLTEGTRTVVLGRNENAGYSIFFWVG